MGVVKGQAMKFFQPYHVDFAIESANEITSEMIDSKVKAAAGTADNVRDASFIGKNDKLRQVYLCCNVLLYLLH